MWKPYIFYRGTIVLWNSWNDFRNSPSKYEIACCGRSTKYTVICERMNSISFLTPSVIIENVETLCFFLRHNCVMEFMERFQKQSCELRHCVLWKINGMLRDLWMKEFLSLSSLRCLSPALRRPYKVLLVIYLKICVRSYLWGTLHCYLKLRITCRIVQSNLWRSLVVRSGLIRILV